VTITDQELMAYADRELDPARAAEVEAALASDPELVRRIARFRKQRQQLQAAFDPVLHEPVPPQLIAAARGIPSIRPRRQWAWAQLTGMAASLVLGAVAAWTVLRFEPEPLMVAGEEGLVARGTLARSLSEELAAEPDDDMIRVGISFRDRSGAYCRTFSPAQGARMAGLACREDDDWRVILVTESQAGGEADYRMAAGAIPPEILRAVEARIAGEPLDAAGETTARARGWAD
jgi:hypothetical protein